MFRQGLLQHDFWREQVDKAVISILFCVKYAGCDEPGE